MTTFNVHDSVTYKIIGLIDASDEHSALQKAKKKFKQKAPLIESVAGARLNQDRYQVQVGSHPSSFVQRN